MKAIFLSTAILLAINVNINLNASAQTLTGSALEIDGNGDAVYIERDAGSTWDDTKAKFGISTNSGIVGLRFQMSNTGTSRTGNFPYQDVLFLAEDGRVAINTTDPASGFALSVDGKIICEELKVRLSNNWPDYVFGSNYNLFSLREIERYIGAEGHLPNMPSAKEISAEGGFKIGEISRMQQEKIEELFLYMIELNRTIENLKARVADLESLVDLTK